MKPSQRIFQQRDIAKNKMYMYAGLLAERVFITPANERQAKTHQALVLSHKEMYKKWRTIYNVLTTEGAIASAQEQQERKKKKQEYETWQKTLVEKVVVEEKTKEDARDNLVNPFGDYVQRQMDAYLSTTTNTVTLNTSLPPTTMGTTYTFTIPRFKVAPPVEMKGLEINDDALIYDEVQEFMEVMEEEVEGII